MGVREWVKMGWDYLRTPRFNPLDMTSSNRSVMAFNLSFLFNEASLLTRAMSDLLAWCVHFHCSATLSLLLSQKLPHSLCRRAEGLIEPSALTVLPMEKVADAHRALESGLTVGKLVLHTGS